MDIKLPPLGEGVDSGSVVGILVKPGDHIAVGQGVIEVETGKAVGPVPSPSAGVVSKILVAIGDKISVGQPILSFEGGPPAPAKPATAPARPPSRSAPSSRADETEVVAWVDEDPPPDGSEPVASPAIRRLARELGLDLRRIHGSAEAGRIVMDDLRAYILRLQNLAARATAPRVDYSKWGPVAKRPLTSLRQAIATHLSESWRATPRVTQFDQADITALEQLRKKHAAAFESKGARLTLTSFALPILAAALRAHPVFNSSLDEAAGEVIYKEYYHIGLAVDTPEGLIVPVLRDVDKKNILTLSKEINQLAVRTRERKISLEEIQGGTFTISNQGGIGGGHFTPIINRPQVAILGLGRGALQPVVRAGLIEPRLMLPLTVAYDHRVIDGAAAVRFMLDLVRGFENFDEKQLL